MEIRIKCTTCKKTQVASDAQTAEARDIGCYFSSCCHAVATVDRVTVRSSRKPRGSTTELSTVPDLKSCR